MASDTFVNIAIIGAGPSGMCAAIKLQQAFDGPRNFIILEKSDNIAGTWWHNQYPGCACDVRSHEYSYSFEM
jgi:cation diffusion facilitator CzcD-associated flavoprotein CzcO